MVKVLIKTPSETTDGVFLSAFISNSENTVPREAKLYSELKSSPTVDFLLTGDQTVHWSPASGEQGRQTLSHWISPLLFTTDRLILIHLRAKAGLGTSTDVPRQHQ